MPLILVTNSEKAKYYCTLHSNLTYIITSDDGIASNSFVFPKGSKLVRLFNSAIRFIEPQIVKIVGKYINPTPIGTMNLVRRLSVFEMIGVFYLLTAGLLASVIVFLFELGVK